MADLRSTRIPVLLAVLFGVPALLGPEGAAQNTESDLATAADCAEILLQGLEDASLTREERIALLDQALLQSLNNFDPCQAGAGSAADGGAAGGGAGGAGGGGGGAAGGVQGTEGSAGESGAESVAESASESVPAGDIQGDLADPQPPQVPQDAPAGGKQETTVAGKTNPNALETTVGTNGKPPKDIPPAENDDIIAKQFRKAAVEETDPVAKAKLWNEYRRYKNLPVQEVPET